MRTTLDVENDVLQAAKELARLRGTTLGKVMSDLARSALEPRVNVAIRNGVPLLPRRADGTKITMKLVNDLRDEA